MKGRKDRLITIITHLYSALRSEVQRHKRNNTTVEVATSLLRMKRGKAVEMIQAARDTNTLWLQDLCNDIVKNGCKPVDWQKCYVTNLRRNTEKSALE